jgi:hypothetical protein
MKIGQLLETETLEATEGENQCPKGVIRLPSTLRKPTPPTCSPNGTRAALDQFQANAIEYFAD